MSRASFGVWYSFDNGTEGWLLTEGSPWRGTKEEARHLVWFLGGDRYAVKPFEDPMKDRMLQFFEYDHLPENLQAVCKPFYELAKHMAATLPSNAERTVAFRKLLEAKDCAVRALFYAEPV
jgi:hypothetical protein